MPIETFSGLAPRLGARVFIHPSALVIGEVDLAEDVSIWPGAVLRGDVNFIRVGAGSNIQDNSVLHVSHRHPGDPEGAPLILGREVTVGHGVILHGCTIGDRCLIGMGSLVLDKTVIEDRVLLGAGSLVPEGKVLESGWLYLGRPAKAVRRLSEDELAHFADSARNYIELAAAYRASTR